MSRPLNPFDPSRPIDPARFIGRVEEIEELEAALSHAKSERPRHFLITGERGVGKTSFLDFIRLRAVENEFNFEIIDFSVNKHTTRLDFARTLKAQLESVMAMHPTHRETFDRIWSFIRRFEIAGVSYNGEVGSENHRDLYQEVADALYEVVKRTCGGQAVHGPHLSRDGVLILIDEVDQSSTDLDIGSFLKYLLERLNRKGCHKVVLGLAGLEESTDVLLRSHASSLRIFDELLLLNLERDEVDELLDEVQVIVTDEWLGEFTITPAAREMLFKLSGGHPHMLHQFGYSAFEKACGVPGGLELVVDESHVLAGAFGRRGALEVVGDMYFRKPLEGIRGQLGVLLVLDHLSEVGAPQAVGEIVEHTALSESEAKNSLDLLMRSKLVVQEAARFGVRHPALAYWIKDQGLQLA